MKTNWHTGIPHTPGMYVWRIPGCTMLGLRTVTDCGSLIEHGWGVDGGEVTTRKGDVAPLGKWSGSEWMRVEPANDTN